jgi:uncharacterized protein (TIGR02145 family)
MKKFINLLAGMLILLVTAGCQKEVTTDADPFGSSSSGHLKISGIPVEFSGIGTVTLTHFEPSFTQSEFWYDIKATGTSIVKLDLGIQVDYREVVILSVTGATANYSSDPAFRKYPAYKDTKWIMLTLQVPAGSTTTVKLIMKGYWNAEPRRSILAGSSGFAEGQLEVPIREPGTLAVVETLTLLPSANGMFTVNCAVLNDGGSEVYERGVYYDFESISGPIMPASAIKVISGSGLGNYSCEIPGPAAGGKLYVMAYAYNRCTGTYLDNTISYGSLLIYPEPVFNFLNTFQDTRDGRFYKTLVMNDGKEWMVENLAWMPSDNWFWRQVNRKTKQYSGIFVYGYLGTSVAEAKLTAEYAKYGCLYDFERAKTACPPGSHLPSDAEWKALEKAYGMADAELDLFANDGRNTGAVGAGMKTTSINDWFWYDVSLVFAGNNRTGFSAVGSGRTAVFSNGDIRYVWEGQDACFWTSTVGPTGQIYRNLKYASIGVNRFESTIPAGLSVRCIIDR